MLGILISLTFAVRLIVKENKIKGTIGPAFFAFVSRPGCHVYVRVLPTVSEMGDLSSGYMVEI